MKFKNTTYKLLLIMAAALFALLSCGKKTMIRAPVRVRPPAVNNLKCHVRKNFVELEWQIPEWSEGEKLGRKIASFKIWRATVTPSERNCPGCPKEFALIGMVDLAYPPPAHIIGKTILSKDLGVKIGNQYFYRIITIDNEGNESLISNTTVANVSFPPLPPKIFQAVATHDGIEISWEDPKKTVKGKTDLRPRRYLLSRKSEKSHWRLITTGSFCKTSYTDMKIEPGKTYEYRVRTEAQENGTPTLSDFSNIVKVKALELPPPAPPDTIWVLPSSDGVTIHWLQSEVDKHEILYNVYRKTADGKIVKLTDKPINMTSFLDRNVEINKIYKYAITSVRIGKNPSEGPYSKWVEIRFVPL